MNCWRADVLMAAYVDGELSRADSDAVREHLASCDECRSNHDTLASVPDLDLPTFDDATETALWDELDQRIAAGLQDRRARPLAPGGRRMLQLLPRIVWQGEVAVPNMAAAAYLALLLGVSAWGLGQSRQVVDLNVELDSSTQALSRLAAGLESGRFTPVLSQVPKRLVPAIESVVEPDDQRPERGVTSPTDPDFAPDGRARPVVDQRPIGPVHHR